MYLEQLYTFGDPKRDPRGRVSHGRLLRAGARIPRRFAPEPTPRRRLVSVAELPALAFDHRKIVEYAHQRIRNKLDYTNVGFELLPDKFTLTELQLVHEAILGENLDKRNFRRKIIQKGIVKPTKEWQHTGRKPAQLYRFSQ